MINFIEKFFVSSSRRRDNRRYNRSIIGILWIFEGGGVHKVYSRKVPRRILEREFGFDPCQRFFKAKQNDSQGEFDPWQRLGERR